MRQVTNDGVLQREILPRLVKEGKLKTGGEIKIGWLVSGQERRKQEKARGYWGFHGKERENSVEGN